MNTRETFFILILLGLAACGGSGGEPNDRMTSAASTKVRIFPDDSEVIAKIYDNSYQVPNDFFMDDRHTTAGSFSLYHVKDTSMSYERCSNDYQQALDWEAEDNANRAVGGDFIGSVESDNYFEFVRKLYFTDSIANSESPFSSGFARVFKCNYVDRAGADRNLRNGYAGQLNRRPLSASSIKNYAQYMWQFTFFTATRKAVLETFSTEKDDVYQHTLLLAFLTNQRPDRCDLIEVVDWIFSVNKVDGEIGKQFNLLYQMEARLEDGVAVQCIS